MEPRFSQRTSDTMESFIMQLIAVANKPGMISFATGLPDKRLFDVKGIEKAAIEVMEGEDAGDALQYGVTEGFPSLRKKIADRCKRTMNIDTKVDNVFITNGSQECFDNLGKMFLDCGDKMIVENPCYLGALQSYSVYAPKYIGVDLNNDGPNLDQLTVALKEKPKLFYGIPNYQNPSGMCYSEESRKQIAEMLSDSETLMIEDDAYGELGYDGRAGKAIRSMSDNVVLTGSYSKIISPGMRIGWMVIPDWMIEQTKVSLEAGCLHAGSFSQRIMDRFLEKNDLDVYLKPIRAEYKRKRDLFLDLMEDHLPDTMSWNDPTGGIFVWLLTPKGTDAMHLYDAALKKKLVLMPGRPFHIRNGENTIRLNFATACDEDMKKGMEILSKVCKDVF
ncbi:MAG: PLP-dependent aminotransferase family protein [Candidatus Methanomethylophilaceae archaeon]